MSLAGYTTDVETRDRGALAVWLEIEGLPYAYGNVSKDSTWFASRAAGAQFEGIKPWFAKDQLPSLPPQELDHLEGAVGGGALTVQIVDVDGSLTELVASARTDGRCAFVSDLAAGVLTNQNVTGDTSTWAASGTAYVGWETISYSAKTSTSVDPSARGKYRSRDVLHEGGAVDVGVASNGSDRIDRGEILTPYPTKLEGRRVWLMAGHSPATDAACTEVWSGVIEEVAFGGADLRTLALSCSQAFAELNQPAFTDLGTFGIPNVEGEAPAWVIYSRTQPGGAGSFTTPETYTFGSYPTARVTPAADDESAAKRRHFIASDWRVYRTSAAFTTANGLSVSVANPIYPAGLPPERTALVGGAIGSFIRECVYVNEGVEPFSAGTHPLQVLLQILISDKGDGANSATYDVLPPDFGLGIAADRVDVAGIEEYIEATSDLRVRGLLVEPIEKFGVWAREALLKPFGFFLRPSLANLLSVGRMESPSPAQLSGAATITSADVVSLGNWRSDTLSIVGQIAWRSVGLYSGSGVVRPDESGIDPVPAGPPSVLSRDGRIVAIDHPRARTLDVNALWARDPRGTLRLDFITRVAARFSQPVALLDVTLNFKHILREVGDFVSLTHDLIPSRYSATRGVSSQLWEVVKKAPDLRRMTVTLTLRQTAVADLDTRYLAPAMLVDGAPAGNDVTVDQTAYVASGQDATDAFVVNDLVYAYDPADLYNRLGPFTINAIAGAVVTLDSAAGIADGMSIIHADYVEWDTTNVPTGSGFASLAFRSPPTLTLTDSGAVTADPHEMA